MTTTQTTPPSLAGLADADVFQITENSQPQYRGFQLADDCLLFAGGRIADYTRQVEAEREVAGTVGDKLAASEAALAAVLNAVLEEGWATVTIPACTTFTSTLAWGEGTQSLLEDAVIHMSDCALVGADTVKCSAYIGRSVNVLAPLSWLSAQVDAAAIIEKRCDELREDANRRW